MSFAGDVAPEIDRLVVATHERGQAMFADHELARSLKAHPGLVNGIGTLMVDGPVEVDAVAVIYPYLPDSMREALIQNNVDEGVVVVENGLLRVTEAGRVPALAASVLLDDAAASMWGDADLAGVEDLASDLVAYGRTIDPPIRPSAFALTERLVNRPTQPGRAFRLLSAVRYWRADAHRAAWHDAGLSVLEAHALNRLWDIDRDVDRVGQGFPAPGKRGVAALEARGWAADGAITDDGRKQRESIESSTDERTDPIYAGWDDSARDAFLRALTQLPS